jgi:hypothetical protein
VLTSPSETFANVEDYMTNRLRSFLALPLLLLSPALAVADTITTFDVEGTAINEGIETLDDCPTLTICPFSGMFQVDVTTGTYESSGLAITLPGLPTFDTLDTVDSSPGELVADNSIEGLILTFTTEPTPGSLVDFTGGTITGSRTIASNYFILGGTITPVPEPSSLLPLAGGIGWLVFGLARRRRARMR